MRLGVRTAILAVLVGVAIAYFAVPARAQDSCRTWVADMRDDEGGAVLAAHACSDDSSQTILSLLCSGGTVWLEHDLALGGTREPQYDEIAEVEFVTDTGIETVTMTFQAMNAMFAGTVAADGRLIALLKSNQSLLVRDKAAAYPARTYSLKGSSAAITKLVSSCD